MCTGLGNGPAGREETRGRGLVRMGVSKNRPSRPRGPHGKEAGSGGESSRPGQQATLGEAAALGLRWPGCLGWQLGCIPGPSWAQNSSLEPNQKERDKL